ncbi:MAG: hypothetical protein AAFR77_15510 [Cyanobacteria bacterium J06631_2]
MQTLLVVSDNKMQFAPQSHISTAFNLVNISILEPAAILSWVQQYQPDLVILNLEWSQVIDLQLITALRLDWLTRSIPILMLGNSSISEQTSAALDYDAFLSKPYSNSALERAICSLVVPSNLRKHAL